jgi:O-antigen/teichoic acid export membrane protein
MNDQTVSASISPSIKKNYFYNTALTVLNILFPLVTFPYVLRVLGPENYGKFAWAASIVGYLAILAGFGLPAYGIKEIAKSRDQEKSLSKVFSSLFLIGSITSLLSLVLLIILTAAVPKIHSDLVLFMVVGFTLFLNIFSIDWYYQGREDYGFICIRSLVFKIVSLVLVFTVIRRAGDYILYAGITVIALGGANIWNMLKSRKHLSLKKGNIDLKPHLKPLFILFLASAIGNVYNMLDTTLLGFLSNNKSVGFYQTDRKLTQLAITIVISLGTVLVPRLAFYLKNKQHDDYARMAERSLQFIYFLALPALALFIGLAPEIVYAMGGPAYGEASLSLILISPIVLITCLDTFLGAQVLIPNNDEKAILFANITGAAVNFTINILLIPKFKQNGSAIAIAVSESAVLLTQWFLGRKYIRFRFFNMQTLKYLAGSAVIGLIIMVSKTLFHNPWIILGTSAFASALFYGIFMIATKDLFAGIFLRTAAGFLKGRKN